jgi:alkaline phosphatase D
VKELLNLALSRRRFLQAAIAGAGAATVGLGCNPSVPSYPFTLGIACGDPLADRIVLWTRLAMEPLAPGGAGGMDPVPYTVAWEIADDEAFSSIVRSGYAVAHPSLGHSVHVDANGLEPDHWYFYRFHVGGHVSPTGRARTFPRAEDAPALMRFVTASCQNWQSGFWPAHAAIAQEDIDFVAFLGDYIYESGAGTNVVRPHDGPRIADLAGYRNRYALYKSDLNLQAAHELCPWIVTWDDHEASNNYAGLIQDETLANPALFPALRAAAYQAWYEHNPVRLLPPKTQEFRIYRNIPFGDLASFFVLDTRQYRTNQPCGDGLKAPCAGFPDPLGDVLGLEQENWLVGGISGSTSRWNVLAQQVVFTPTPIANMRNMDQWDGYPVARQRIVDFLRERPLRDAVVLTGDIHAAGAGWVPGFTPGLPGTFNTPVATEWVSTGISSAGFPPDLALAAEEIFVTYPHLQYFEAVTRGYIRHEVTRDEWRADFRFVDSVAVPVSPVSTRASFVSTRGVLEPEPA